MEPEIARRCTDCGAAAPIFSRQGPGAGARRHAPPPAPGPPAARRPSSEGRRRTAEIIALRPEDEEASRRRRRGVTAAPREAVEEKLTPRVEKLRHASNAMLEEASYDPSLRFVLVAVAAVLLSLFLLLLN